MWVYFYILLLQLGELIEIKMIGTISVAGIVYIFWFLYTVISGKWLSELRSKMIYNISILYLCLFVFQLISEIIVDNEFSNVMKGLAVTALSYMKLLCLWPLVKHDGRRITWLFVCMVISGALSFQFLSDTEFRMDYLLNGTEFSIFKFKIAPVLGDLLVFYSLLTSGKGYVTWLAIFIGVLCMVLGARSTGLMIFLTGTIVFVIDHMGQVITKKQILVWSLIGSLVVYGFFAIYVTAVLNGTIKGGNSKDQFAKVENPYNPLYILLSGRSESSSSLAAIKDRPITGFGAWSKDPGYKYHKIQAKSQGNIFVIKDGLSNLIPAHSVILQTGVHEGVFAMLTMICILYFFIKRGILSLKNNSRYNFLVVYCIMQLLWHGLFSPVSHFRNEFPIYFCCCLFAYRYDMLSKMIIRSKLDEK